MNLKNVELYYKISFLIIILVIAVSVTIISIIAFSDEKLSPLKNIIILTDVAAVIAIIVLFVAIKKSRKIIDRQMTNRE